ncbi:Phosphatidylinositol glycan anchor biosynthesis class U protein [Vitis vinifera]|uniref:Phosphatidylinositol glycan anchor biosynthesis class U protein n=1 Tax=Vitis vinifera TaxID=29760 RepID=A0A438BZF9_VITVI|nr:Phosphatidylinositol glycan anchor biosynthesis class U protein [Vitis vinifera]
MEEEKETTTTKKKQCFWTWAMASVIFRLVLIHFSRNLNLASRPEVSTPLTSLRRCIFSLFLYDSQTPAHRFLYLNLDLNAPFSLLHCSGRGLLAEAILNFSLCRIHVPRFPFVALNSWAIDSSKVVVESLPTLLSRGEGQYNHLICSLLFVIADFMTAVLIRATGQNLQMAYNQSLKSLGIVRLLERSEMLSSGDIAALVYLWNPLTIVTCVGSSTSPIENLVVVLSLYGACRRLVPLAAFGWVIATHLSLYPAILIVPLILILGYGPDSPRRKLFQQRVSSKVGENPSTDIHYQQKELASQPILPIRFSWWLVVHFILWASLWSCYVLLLCGISVRQYGGLGEMFKRYPCCINCSKVLNDIEKADWDNNLATRDSHEHPLKGSSDPTHSFQTMGNLTAPATANSDTYGFILTVPDLSPNIGVLWYFFAEVFDYFRNFFLIVFHVNILFMILPLAIRLNHRPCFLAFVYIAISSLLKSYPSVFFTGPVKQPSFLWAALPYTLEGQVADLIPNLHPSEDMQFSFFLFCGYVGISFLSPVMHNLWIWRGTGNANFYFATAMAYACFQPKTKQLSSLATYQHPEGHQSCMEFWALPWSCHQGLYENFLIVSTEAGVKPWTVKLDWKIILVVESVSAMLNHDRMLRKLSIMKP